MHSFKRLSPYVGPDIPEQVRQNAQDFWDGLSLPPGYQPGNWEWVGLGFELDLCNLDSDSIDPVSLAIIPRKDGTCVIACSICGRQFKEDIGIAESKIFDSIQQAKAFLDSVLALPTPEIQPQPVTPETTT
jgi:hypothetical protein